MTGYQSRSWAFFAVLLLQLNATSSYNVDPSTSPDAATTVRKFDGKVLQLVMSDEFNVDGRSFEKGQDDVFEAVTKPDEANEAMQFCT